MRATLLKNLRSHLETELGLASRAVFITPADNWMPTGTPAPCLGIRDSGHTDTEGAAGVIDTDQRLALTIWTPLDYDGEKTITGVAGTLTICEKIEQVLRGYSPSGVLDIRPTASSGTKLMPRDGQWLVAITITAIAEHTQ